MFILNLLCELLVGGLIVDVDNGSFHGLDVFLSSFLLDLLLLELEVALALLLGLGPSEPLVQRYSRASLFSLRAFTRRSVAQLFMYFP